MRGNKPTPKQRVLAVYPFAYCEQENDGRWHTYSRRPGVHGGNKELGLSGGTPNFAWQHAAMALPKPRVTRGVRPSSLLGFDRTELDDVANALDADYDRFVYVGEDSPQPESVTAFAARFIRAALAAGVKTAPDTGTGPWRLDLIEPKGIGQRVINALMDAGLMNESLATHVPVGQLVRFAQALLAQDADGVALPRIVVDPTLPPDVAVFRDPSGKELGRIVNIGTDGVPVRGKTMLELDSECLREVVNASGFTERAQDGEDIVAYVRRIAGVRPSSDFAETKARIMTMPEVDLRQFAIAQAIQLQFHEKYGNAMTNASAAFRAEAAPGVRAPVAYHDKDQPNGIAWCPGFPEGLKDITPLYADGVTERLPTADQQRNEGGA